MVEWDLVTPSLSGDILHSRIRFLHKNKYHKELSEHKTINFVCLNTRYGFTEKNKIVIFNIKKDCKRNFNKEISIHSVHYRLRSNFGRFTVYGVKPVSVRPLVPQIH